MLGTFQRNQMCPLPNAHASCNTRSLQATGFVPPSDRQEVLYAVKNENAPCDQLTTADNTHTHTETKGPGGQSRTPEKGSRMVSVYAWERKTERKGPMGREGVS